MSIRVIIKTNGSAELRDWLASNGAQRDTGRMGAWEGQANNKTLEKRLAATVEPHLSQGAASEEPVNKKNRQTLIARGST